MRLLTLSAAAAACVLMSGCKTVLPSTDPSFKAVMLCGAGGSNRVSADLSAKIAKNLRDQSAISAGVQQEIKTAFLGGADSSNATSEKAYEAYLACVKDIRIP